MILNDEILKVISSNYCVGCGTCAAVNEDISMEFDSNGQYKPEFKKNLSNRELSDASAVCPFTSIGENEDQISEKLFKSRDSKFNKYIGHYLKIYTGRVLDKKAYSKSSSGGIIKFLLAELLEKNFVSKVIHVKSSQNGEPLFYFDEADQIDSLLNGSNSSYHPVEWSKVIDKIRTSNERYAVVGLPCFIKSLRKYMKYYGINKNKVITIGLICGHLKSKFYAYMLSQQLDLPYKSLKAINFRKKILGKKANEKGVEVFGTKDFKSFKNSSIVQELFGTDYGFGLFKLKACDFCDDIFAETADLVVGDAWLPRYLNRGRSLILTRLPFLSEILIDAKNKKKIVLSNLSLEEAIESQYAGIRHRKMGLSYRLYLEIKKGNWVPKKRVSPSKSKINIRYKAIQILRILSREKSFEFFKDFLKNNDYLSFEKKLSFYFRIYRSFYGSLILIPIKLFFALLGINSDLLSKFIERIKKRFD